MHRLLDFKIHNSFQNENNRKAIIIFAPGPLILELENKSFENISFSQQ